MVRKLLVAVLLIASAIAQSGHGILLTWTQPAGVTVTANAVYRGTTSGGPYTLLLSSATPITSFLDTTGTTGTNYCYVVTDTAGGVESGYSNEVCRTFPPPPPTLSGVKQ